jgi:pimeloyl-ACP methyl ester carboxylesterase
MNRQLHVEDDSQRLVGTDARAQLLAGLPVMERRLELAGISTAVLEGGDGPPVILLHGPAEHAIKWLRVLPELVRTYRVVAPDLPGHGASEIPDGRLDTERVLGWLGKLIDATCPSPPALVGYILGGSIAARFTAEHPDRVSRLVLVDSLGLRPFEPAPEFGQAAQRYFMDPSEETHDHMWQHCVFDLDGVRTAMGERWTAFAAYNIDRVRTPSVQAALHTLLEQFGMPAIPAEVLAKIVAPTTLIWGRHDLATPLEVAEAVSARYGWPLHVIDDAADDPPLEEPEAFLEALRTALGSS